MNVHFEKISLEVSSLYLNFGIFGTKILGFLFFPDCFQRDSSPSWPTLWKKKTLECFHPHRRVANPR